MATVCVLGSNGYLGQALFSQLLARGYSKEDVLGIDIVAPSADVEANIQFEQCDICNKEALASLLKGKCTDTIH